MFAGSKLLPDFFLEVSPEQLAEQMKAEGATPAFYKSAPTGGAASAAGPSSSTSASAAASATSGPAHTFKLLEGMLSEDLVKKVNGVFQFDLTGECDIECFGLWLWNLWNSFPLKQILIYL